MPILHGPKSVAVRGGNVISVAVDEAIGKKVEITFSEYAEFAELTLKSSTNVA